MQITEQTGLATAAGQKAIGDLEQDGYVYAVSGRGKCVTPRRAR